MTSHETFDVLVVGARAAGAATAMLLAERGLDVLLVDKGSYGSDTLSTHALMRGGVLQLHRWGLLPEIAAAGTPAVRRTSFHYGDAVVEIPIKASHGVDALFAPRRTVLDPVLVDAAAAAGAVVRHRTGLVDLLRDGRGQVIGAVLKESTGRPYVVRAGRVVGADGAGSTVARLVDAPVLHQGRHATAVIYGYWQGLAVEGYHWHYRPGTSAGVIPTTSGRTCVFAAMPPERLKGVPLETRYREVLAECHPLLAEQLAAARLEGRLMAFAGRPGFMRQAHGPGWALVGDAGYFKDPITAHGLTDALCHAELLAMALTDGRDAALTRYARLRDELSARLFAVTDAIAAFDWDLDEIAEHHVELNRAMRAEVEHLSGLAPSAAALARRGRAPALLPAAGFASFGAGQAR